MSGGNDSFTPDDITTEALLAMFNDAYIDASLDDDGDIRIKEDYITFIKLSGNARRIRLFTIFGIAESASILDKLELLNNINRAFVVIRASMPENGTLLLDYHLLVDGGITKKAIVRAYRMFTSIIDSAIKENNELIA